MNKENKLSAFKDLVVNAIIPKIEKMMQKEKEHMHSLIENSAPIEFIKTSQKSYNNFVQTIDDYKKYLNQTTEGVCKTTTKDNTLADFIMELENERIKYLMHDTTNEDDIFNYRYNIGSAHRLADVIEKLKVLNIGLIEQKKPKRKTTNKITANLIGYWPNLSRAFEIALLGEFSLQIVFDKEYVNGFEDYRTIKGFYRGVSFSDNGDMVVKIYKPEDDISKNCETLSDIFDRVKIAKNNTHPTEFQNSSCDALLKTATSRLNLSIEKVDLIVRISSVIAQLEKSKHIRVEHIAEAVNYNFRDNVGSCNAEGEIITFGKGIQVATHELNSEHIQNAIEHLKSLL